MLKIIKKKLIFNKINKKFVSIRVFKISKKKSFTFLKGSKEIKIIFKIALKCMLHKIEFISTGILINLYYN